MSDAFAREALRNSGQAQPNSEGSNGLADQQRANTKEAQEDDEEVMVSGPAQELRRRLEREGAIIDYDDDDLSENSSDEERDAPEPFDKDDAPPKDQLDLSQQPQADPKTFLGTDEEVGANWGRFRQVSESGQRPGGRGQARVVPEEGGIKNQGRLLTTCGRWCEPLGRLLQRVPTENPQSARRRAWDGLIFLLVIYIMISLPLFVGFDIGGKALRRIQVFENVVDGLFFLDVVYNFFTAYMDHHLNLVTDKRAIARNYLGTYFPIDLVSTIPFDRIGQAAFSSSEGSELTAVQVLKVTKVLRLSRMMRFLERIKHANGIRIVRLVMYFVMATHWFACFYHFIGITESASPTWIDETRKAVRERMDDLSVAYTHSFYEILIMFMGEGTGPVTIPETLYTSVVLLFGALFYAMLAGLMSMYVAEFNYTSSQHRETSSAMSDSMRYLGVSSQLKSRVGMYYDYLANFHHPGPEGFSLLSTLPEPLYKDVCYHSFGKSIKAVPLFHNVERQLISELAKRLEHVVILPGQMLFEAGQVGVGLYIVMRGVFEVFSGEGTFLSRLDDGAYFGEVSLLVTARRSQTVRALTHSDVAFIPRPLMLELMGMYPKSARRIWLTALDRYNRLRQEKEEGEHSSSPLQDQGGSEPSRASIDTASKSGLRKLRAMVDTSKNASFSLKNSGPRVSETPQVQSSGPSIGEGAGTTGVRRASTLHFAAKQQRQAPKSQAQDAAPGESSELESLRQHVDRMNSRVANLELQVDQLLSLLSG